MSNGKVTMLAVGDLILGEPEPETFFEHAVDTLRSGDVVVGQVEVAYTTSEDDPGHVPTLAWAGFNVGTFAGNHTFDRGEAGVRCTISALQRHGIAQVGGGMTITEARRPAFIERNGTRFGFLSYNCAGPAESWARPNKPGAAYVHIITHYELDHATPGGPPTIYTFPEPTSFATMLDDVRGVRSLCDVLVVAFHKGLGHTPAKLAAYEGLVARAAIDAGADVILAHHAHIGRGIELYHGKPIFHGLGNFVTVTRALSAAGNPDREAWAWRRKELFGFEPDPEYPTYYSFHPESKYTMIAKCVFEGGSIAKISYLPCLINKKAQPEVLKNDERGQEVFKYFEKITKIAGLNAKYAWDGDEISVLGDGQETSR